ncbi:MAG: HD domain-containing protein [Clostridiaceae bacterium]|nr:HD domain-containing protein [Clostridiaceae bacterium]
MSRKKLAAAIDVGSHEINMKIVELERNEAPRVIETVRRTLAIGTDTYNTGRISQSLIYACSDVMSGLADKLHEYRINDCKTVATSAFREASNQLFAIDQIDRACGLEIKVLSNSEERYYHMLAAAEMIPDFDQMIKHGTLILDIGAGSVQASVYDKGEFIFTQNMLLGSLRIREILADLERQAVDFGGLMAEYVSGDLENYRMLEPKGTTYKNLIVLGGENHYLNRMAGKDSGAYQILGRNDFDKLYDILMLTKSDELAMERGIAADHAPLLLPAAMIIKKFMNFTGVDKLHMPVTGMTEGLLLEQAYLGGRYKLKHDPENDTISACRHLAKRFKTDRGHGQTVEKLALDLFRQTTRLHRLSSRYQTLIQAAAILHDIGKYISMSRHTYKSYHVIMASEIIGISRVEQTIIALIARYHSGPVDLEDAALSELEPQARLAAFKLIALFRLANALDTGHLHKLDGLEVEIDDKELIITLDAGREITLERWNMEKNSDMFIQVYGLVPRIKLRRRRKV